jgi:hypothetical protein
MKSATGLSAAVIAWQAALEAQGAGSALESRTWNRVIAERNKLQSSPLRLGAQADKVLTRGNH